MNNSAGEKLQTFNSELEKSLESIKERRNNVYNEITQEEERKKSILEQILKIKKELEITETSLDSNYELKNEYEKIIYNSESAFKKILENSKTLLTIIKKDEEIILKKIADNKEF